jgi:uncharacterized protein
VIYVDTSALVKRYIREPGSERVEKALVGADIVSTSVLAYAELLSALARKRRSRDVSEKSFRLALNRFEEDWADILVVDLHKDLFPLIKKLIEKHALRGADAVHLSSALWLTASSGLPVVFWASDAQLVDAAKAEGVSVVDPEEG